jgi:hypothetical protein
MEIKMGEMVLSNNLEQAKNVVRDIIKNDRFIQRMDVDQLENVDGKISLKETFIKSYLYHEKIRTEKTVIIKRLHESTLIQPIVIKYRLMPYINKVVSFVVACKYRLMRTAA